MKWMRLGVWLTLIAIRSAPAAAEPEAKAAPPGPLDVDAAVRLALVQNAAHRQAEASVGIAEGARLDAMAGLLPGASGSYSYSKSQSTTTLQDLELQTQIVNGVQVVTQRGSLELDSEQSGSGFGVSVREDLSFSGWYRYRGAQADVQSARHGLEASGQDLAFRVRQQFYLVLRAQDLLHVQEEDLRLAQDQERRITSMFELGSVARVDVLKAKVRVSEADLALIRQQNQVDIEKARFSTLLGYPADTELTLTGELRGGVVPVDSSQVVEDAVQRPDLLQAKERVRSASNLYRSALLSRVPGLFATFDWDASSGSSQSDNVNQQLLTDFPGAGDSTLVLYAFPVDSDAEQDGWNFRLGATVSLDAFINMGQHKRTRSFQRQVEYELEGLELEVQREIEEAILNFRASQKALEAAESGLVSAEEDLRLSQERYQQGLGTVLELLEAQVALTRARNNQVNALTGLKISEAALDKARGAPLPY